MARVNEGRRVSSKSPSLARAGEEEGARKRTKLDLRIPIWDYIFMVKNKWREMWSKNKPALAPAALQTVVAY